MPNKAPQRLDELLITRGAPSAQARGIQRAAKADSFTRLADGIYVQGTDHASQSAIVRRNWQRIAAAVAPQGVVSHRSAYSGGITDIGTLIVSHPKRFNRNIELPGLRIALVRGPGPLAGDLPLAKQALYLASPARMLLENLVRVRGRSGKSAGARAVEDRLLAIMNASGENALDRIRDDAHALAPLLGMTGQFAVLDGLIGALLATRAAAPLKSTRSRLAATGTPVDAERMARFEVLASRLRAIPLTQRPAVATGEPARANLAFLEAYFSNFVEGTEFAIEEARDIALQGRIVARRLKDSHDILSVFELAHRTPWRDTVPAFGPDFPDQLAQRHALMMRERPEVLPGHFKLENNRAGGTWFVEPRFVRGTLMEGSLMATSVMEGLPRAIYYAFLVSEVHPFSDGNGRISRLIMNAELSRMGQARIIIPTLLHEEYVDCQRQLSAHNDPTGHINTLALAQEWTCALDFSDVDRLIDTAKRTNAIERTRSRFKLTMPDGSPLRKKG